MNIKTASTDQLEQILSRMESVSSQARAVQLQVIAELDGRQTATADGCRSLPEWVAGRADVSHETARDLVRLARQLEDLPETAGGLAEGKVTFDRAVAEGNLAAAGASQEVVSDSRGFDISGVRRLAAQQRRITPSEERETFQSRFVALQPSLDESSWRLWGQLPAVDGRIVDQALVQQADRFPHPPEGQQTSRGQRNADALTSICQNSLSGYGGDGGSAPLVTVFVDAGLAATSHGQAGVTVEAGPRIGPDTLQGLLCNGRVELIGIDHTGRPLAVGRSARVVSPKLRRYVIHRDGGCAADGCSSRYRLQAHHKVPYSAGGATHPDNLTTLCWFHHHVVIHGMGYHIDPNSPPQRLRFHPPHHSRGPP